MSLDAPGHSQPAYSTILNSCTDDTSPRPISPSTVSIFPVRSVHIAALCRTSLSSPAREPGTAATSHHQQHGLGLACQLHFTKHVEQSCWELLATGAERKFDRTPLTNGAATKQQLCINCTCRTVALLCHDCYFTLRETACLMRQRCILKLYNWCRGGVFDASKPSRLESLFASTSGRLSLTRWQRNEVERAMMGMLTSLIST